MKKTKIQTPNFDYKQIKVRIINDSALYIELNKHIYYIDDSTNEQIFKIWKDSRKLTIVLKALKLINLKQNENERN